MARLIRASEVPDKFKSVRYWWLMDRIAEAQQKKLPRSENWYLEQVQVELRKGLELKKRFSKK